MNSEDAHEGEENMAHALKLSEPEHKIIIIGALGVGKTSLLMRYIHGRYEDRLSRFVAEEEKVISLDGKDIHLKIWDTAGQERYQSITNRFYGDTDGVVIVYDIMQEETWRDVDFWVKELQYYLPQELEDGMPVLFVGNKKDLVDRSQEDQKSVSLRVVQEVAHSHHVLPPIEVSAKTGAGVDKAFLRVVKSLRRKAQEQGSPGQPKLPDRGKKCCRSS